MIPRPPARTKGASQVDPAGVIISYRGSHTTASPGQTTSGLQGPTAATGIYCGWSSEDVNCDGGLDVDEDVDHDGNLDVNEDVDGDGNLDVDEDTLLRNGRLDSGEDKDFDGRLDVDEDLDGDGRLDTVNEDSRDAGGDGDGRLDRAAEDLDDNDTLTSYNHWNFGTASAYPCLADVTPDCRTQRRASVTVTAADPVSVNEGDSATYTVVLDFMPTANVVITMSSNNGDVTTQPASLTFTTGNWQTAQTVTVSAGQDDDDADDAATISHAASGADEYVGIAVASVAVSVTDNDRATTLSVNSPHVTEGDTGTTTPMTFTFTLNQFSTQTVTARITIGIPGQTAGKPDDYEETTNSIFTMTFAPGETTKTLVLTVKGDDLAEPDETVRIAVSHLTNVVFGSGFGPHSLPGNMVATGTIVDDDSSENRRASVTVTAADPVAVNEGWLCHLHGGPGRRAHGQRGHRHEQRQRRRDGAAGQPHLHPGTTGRPPRP